MPLKPVINPFEGDLQFINCPSAQDDSPAITNPFECDASANVGDFVYQSLTIDKFAEVATDNNSLGPIMGFIKSKISATQALVTMIGLMTGHTGLENGKQVFIDTDGTATSTPPLVDFQQVLGYANSDSELYFRPEFKRTKKA